MRIAKQWDIESPSPHAKKAHDLSVFVDRFGEELKDAEANHARSDTDHNEGYLKAMRWVKDELRQAGVIQ